MMQRKLLKAFLFLVGLISLSLKAMHERTRSKRKIDIPPIVLNPDQFLETYLERSVKHKGEHQLSAQRTLALKIIETARLHKPSKATLACIEKTAQACDFKKNLFVKNGKSTRIEYLDFDIFQLELNRFESPKIFTSTIFHELGHATLGHCLENKKKTTQKTKEDNHKEEFASDTYAIEHSIKIGAIEPLVSEIIEYINDPDQQIATFTHPAPIERARNILDQLNEHLKPQAISVQDLTSAESTLLDRRTKIQLKSALISLKD